MINKLPEQIQKAMAKVWEDFSCDGIRPETIIESITKHLWPYLSIPKDKRISITDSDIERIMLEIDEAKEQIRKYLSFKK